MLKKIFGTAQTRKLKKYKKIVSKVNSFEKEYQNLSEEQLKDLTSSFKKRYQNKEPLNSLLPEAYAVVKNICRRLCGEEIHVSGYEQKWDMIPYDVQILGAIAMHYGSISEMQTGEGKTITAAMPLYLNALSGKPVHLVTVNDYLAKRDCEWIGIIFKRLGLTVSYLTNDIMPYQRREIYESDIVYGTASEFGFDYLRDHSMVSQKEEQVQRPNPYFAIIDEIDSILIDESRTPLIISGPASKSYHMYKDLKDSVSKLVKKQREFCSELATNAKKIIFSEDAKSSEKDSAFKNLFLVNKGTPRNNILKKIKENPDYRVQIDKWETYFYSEQNKKEKYQELAKLYIIIDERNSEFELTDKGIQSWLEYQDDKDTFTMIDLGYEYSLIDKDDSLSSKEKIERKNSLREEDIKRKEKNHNLRQLLRAHLLMEKNVDYIISENKIVIIDENTGRPQPGRRFSDGLHQAIEAKENVSIQGETQTYATTTLQNYFRLYEKLAGMTGTAITEAPEFKEIYNLDVLEIPTYCPCIRKDFNDKIFMTEREKYVAIIQEIKEKHKIGRPILIGTESVEISEKLSRILKQNRLSHNVLNAKNHSKEAEIIASAGKKGSITLATNMAGRGTDIKLSEEVKEIGGLHVIGANRHHSRRIDRQLRGRSGRLGDPGSSQFFVSFEDSLMRIFASARITAMLRRFRPKEGEAISAKILNKSIETAQKRIEQRNYNIRKHTLEYDDVINKQRQEIYTFRNELLFTEDVNLIAKDLIDSSCIEIITDNPNYIQELMLHFPVTFEENDFKLNNLEPNNLEPNNLEPNNFQSSDLKSDTFHIIKVAQEKIKKTFEKKLSDQLDIISQVYDDIESAKKMLNEIIKSIILSKIDSLWQEHLLAIDHLRSDVNLRAIGQKDPLLEFKHEAFRLFDMLSKKIKLETATNFFKFEIAPKEEQNVKETIETHMQETTKEIPKQKRNSLCHCGSGKKYKKCCGIKS